mmetsp:Transcript_1410/g.3128  ORF Transcript_1410/g.3128 Transcript_1410/m.3128 type:complete len:391 (-) Transcript_1410:422-1594(-)
MTSSASTSLLMLMQALWLLLPCAVSNEIGNVNATVSIDNFLVAETDTYMAKFVPEGALGKFYHLRTMAPVDTSPGSGPEHGQAVIRMNRDTLYSFAVLDLSTPATISYPSSVGKRFVSMMVGSESHDVFPMVYEPGNYLVTREGCSCSNPPCWAPEASQDTNITCFSTGTPFAFVFLRTQANPDDDKDLALAHAVQDDFTVQQASIGKFDVPHWNLTQLSAIRESLKFLRSTSLAPPVFGFFTGPNKIDRLDGTLCVAAGWGGGRREDQTYDFWQSQGHSGTYTLRMPKVPAAMWSATVYNKEGFMFSLPANFNSKNNEAPGSDVTTIFFGNCEDPSRQVPSAANCLGIEPGWGLVLRFFRPGKEILDGSWKPAYPEPDQKPEVVEPLLV